MFVYIGDCDDDDLMGPPLVDLMCSECGSICNTTKYEYTAGKEYDHMGYSYKVISRKVKCRDCQHEDYIIANNKASYIDMELFSHDYDLDELRNERKKIDEAKQKEVEEYRKKTKRQSIFEKLNIDFSVNPELSLFKQIKEWLTELFRLGQIAVLCLALLDIILVIALLFILYVASFALAFLGIYLFLGLFTGSVSLQIYVALTAVFVAFEVLIPLLKKKSDLASNPVFWIVRLYEYTKFPYFFQFIILFVVTVIDLGNIEILNNNILWETITSAIYPAVVTPIIIREITGGNNVEATLKKNELPENQREKSPPDWLIESIRNSKAKDSSYLEILKLYFATVSLPELKNYSPKVYRMVESDFSETISRLDEEDRETISIAAIVKLYEQYRNYINSLEKDNGSERVEHSSSG